MSLLAIVLVAVALVLAVVTLIQTRGQNLLSWAVVLIAAALLLPVLLRA